MEIPTGLFSTATPIGALVGFVALVGWLIVKGKLIPESLHDRIVAGKDDRIVAQEKIIERQSAQLSRAMEAGESSLHLLRSIAPPEEQT